MTVTQLMDEVIHSYDGESHNSASHMRASRLLRDILIQITEKDAPSVNEAEVEPKENEGVSGTATISPTFSTIGGGSTSLSSPVTADLAGSSSFGSSSHLDELHETKRIMMIRTVLEEKETHDSLHNQDVFSLSIPFGSASKLGHDALVSLCVSTLRKLEGAREKHWAAPYSLHTKNSDHETGKKVHMTPASHEKRNVRNRKKFKLLRRMDTEQDGSFPQEEKKEDESPQQQQQQRRLHMFGSEYARHLSNSQLAPAIMSSKPIKSPKSMIKSLHVHQPSTIRSLEEASLEIQTGALLDIAVTVNDEHPPTGYYRMKQTAAGQRFGIVGSPKKIYYLNVKKEASWDKAAQRPCVTAITLIYPDRQEFVPPGFCIVRYAAGSYHSGQPADLNPGGNERIFLCFRRSREGNPITGLLPIMVPEAIPIGYTLVERSPRNHVACLAGSFVNRPIFLAYRQRLASLETLRPLPLVETVSRQCKDQPTEKRVSLKSYYCTGGSVVASNIGRFHIMDRTTHSLLSPSSVANRLNLIEMSRRRAAKGDCGEIEPINYASSYTRSDIDGASTSGASHTSTSSALRGSGSLGAMCEKAAASVCSSNREDETTNEEDTTQLSSLLAPREDTLPCEESERDICREAMIFIPEVEIPAMQCDDEGVVRLRSRILLITPVLTACYTRHGGAALLAVEGLTSLLIETDFFLDDVDFSEENDNDSSKRITLLDLSIQAVCDAATSGAQEILFASCVEFVERAVRFSHGQLNTRTVGFVFRFFLFVFYFDASIHQKHTLRWPPPSWRPLCMHDQEDFPMLFNPRDETNEQEYHPGGAPQAAALALKELITLSLVRLGKVSVSEMMLIDQATKMNQSECFENSHNLEDAYAPMIDNILSTIIDNAVDHVDRANFTQLALYQIHRSGGSELFWSDMLNICGPGLFSKDIKLSDAAKEIYVLLFAMLQQLVKVSSCKIKPNGMSTELSPKDTASKLLSLELLLHLLEYWSDEQEAVSGMAMTNDYEEIVSIQTLAFAVRRTVVPCLLWNTRPGLENPQIFRRVIRIVSELWCSPVYRKHCKVELGILFEHFAVRMLELGPQCIPANRVELHPGTSVLFLSQQIELIGEIKNWFMNDPKDVIEMYLNYDTDISSEVLGPKELLHGTRWQIYQRICSGLSNIAEQCEELIGDQIRQNQTMILTGSSKSKIAKSEEISLEEGKIDNSDRAATREAARALRKISLECIAQIAKALAISSGASTGSAFASLITSWDPDEVQISFEHSLSECSSQISESTSSRRSKSEGEDGILNFWRGAIAKDKKDRSNACKPSPKESFETSFEIAKQKNLKKAIEYLIACNALTSSPRDIANFISFHKEHFDPSDLGIYLSEGGLGGVESEHWAQIRRHFIRAISFNGMSLVEGLRYFLGSSGFRLPGEAQRVDRMMNAFALCYFEDNAGDPALCPFKDQDTVYLIAFAIIMLNTDLHKLNPAARKQQKQMTKMEFINNLLNAIPQREKIPKEILSSMLADTYDSIALSPIIMHENETVSNSRQQSRNQAVQDIFKNVLRLDSLLRGMSVHDVNFATIEDVTNSLQCSGKDALSDLTRSCVSKTWHQWHGAVNTCLDTAHLDPQCIEPAIDILLHAVTVTVCLDMPMERSAFLSQLVRLKAFEERRQGRWVSALDESHREEAWYQQLEEACSCSPESKLTILHKIHSWIESLKGALRKDVRSKVEMTQIVAEIQDGEFLLHDPSRSFRISDDLVKKSARTGRCIEYRFYLFSDVLLYASKEEDGRYKIHEELSLHMMKIVDWFPPSQRKRLSLFDVHHPRKSFQVVCPSHEVRKLWVESIRAAIVVEMERKMAQEAARLSLYTSSSNRSRD